MKRLSIIATVLFLVAMVWAQQGAPSGRHETKGQNPGPTEPQIGYAAQDQTHNVLIGCVGGSANDLLLMQAQQHRTYRLQGNTGEVKGEIGKLVKVTGQLMPGTGPSVSGATEQAPVFQVQAVQNLGQSCRYAAGQPPSPATGKTGSQGEAMNATSTASQGQVTPGFETPAGQAQAPGPHTNLNANGMRPQRNQTATQGAPQSPEQIAQNPADAEKIAQGAQQAELDNAQRQLGVNAQPNYAKNRPEAADGAQTPGGRATTQGQQPQPRGEQQTHPTLVGCLTQAASGGQYVLREKNGTRHRLMGSSDLKDHVNHLVEVVGGPVQNTAGANVAAGGSEPAFEVSGVQDLAATCGAAAH